MLNAILPFWIDGCVCSADYHPSALRFPADPRSFSPTENLRATRRRRRDERCRGHHDATVVASNFISETLYFTPSTMASTILEFSDGST